MALILRADGTREEIKGTRNGQLTLAQLTAAVGGRIDIVHMPSGKLMIVNDDGIAEALPINAQAMQVAAAAYAPHEVMPVVGDVVLAEDSEVD